MNKKEGKILTTANHKSGSGEGSFDNAIDNQLDHIEDQLKKAQETLSELQKVKVKLEEERTKKLDETKKETELLNIQKLQEENKNLKKELKEYQGEINSFKEVIANLKEDLVKNTQQLQEKVTNSLKILEDANTSLKDNGTSIAQSLDKHVKEDSEEEEKGDEVKPDNKEELADNHKEEDTEPNSTAKELGEENEKAEELKEADTEKNKDSEEERTISIEDELKEYEKIKQELSALESDDATSNEPSNQDKIKPEEQISIEDNHNEVEKKEEDNVSTDKKTEENEKNETEKVDKGEENAGTSNGESKIPIKIVPKADNTQEVKEKEEVSSEVKLEPTQEKGNVEPEEKKKPKKRFLGIFGRKTKEQETHEASIPGDSKTPDEDGKEKKRSRFSLLKKKQDKKEAGEEKKETTNKENKPVKADTASGGFLMKTAIFFLILFIGGIIYQLVNADKLRKVYIEQATGLVKGTSDSKVSDIPDGFNGKTPEERYKEAFANLPYADTLWVTHNDPELGIKVDYPKNTSYKYSPMYSQNVWFLRKEGYLMKIEKHVSDQTLEQYRETMNSQILYKSEAETFKGFPALKLVQDEYMDIRGNFYLVKVGPYIYEIWYKTFIPEENIDDEQRVVHMLESIEFLNVPPPVKSKKK